MSRHKGTIHGKSLDDDHGRRATLGTKPKRARLLSGGDGGFDLRLRHHAEQLPAKRQPSGASPVGKEAEVADANETFREQVQQETAPTSLFSRSAG
ncbi:MAG TPA: hypothetical protein VF845_08175 [Terriglobales bacterium]